MSIVSKNTMIPDPPGYAPFGCTSSRAGKLASTSSSSAQAPVSKKARRAQEAAASSAGEFKNGNNAVMDDEQRRTIKKSNELKMKKAWELALAPAKSLPMQAFMLWMSGSGIQIFSMGVVWTLLTSPWRAVWGLVAAFEPYKQVVPVSPSSAGNENTSAAMTPNTKAVITTELVPPMVVFVLCQVGVLALGIYKLSTMGLIPTGSGDWLQFETRPETTSWSSVRLSGLA